MPVLPPNDGVIGRRCCGKLKILGAALQADGETESHQQSILSLAFETGVPISAVHQDGAERPTNLPMPRQGGFSNGGCGRPATKGVFS